MMRALALLLALAGIVPSAFGARRVTVNELEQTIAAAHCLSDVEAARRLSDLELTERLSTAKLDPLKAELPGQKARQALMILVDASVFLSLPPAEIPDRPAPDLATQRKILTLTVDYVSRSIQQFPNFFATRVTRSFEDTPAVLRLGATTGAYRPIHPVADSNVTPTDPANHAVLCATRPQTYNELVAYHGEIAIDPENGTIIRLTLLADMKPDEFTVKSDIEVEYGQISIGGKDYFLPIRNATSSLSHSLQAVGGWGVGGCHSLAVTPDLQASLNDVVFKDYHLFRADATILSDSEAEKLEGQPLPAAPPSTIAAASNPPAPPDTAATSAVRPEQASTVAQIPNPTDSASAPSATASPVAPTADASNIPVFRATTRQVLVDVVVDKKNGDPVSGLPQTNFSITENGKHQTIDFFEEHSTAASAPVSQPAMPALPPGALTNVPTTPARAALYVFLLDSLNTEPQDQIYLRQQILAFLHKLDPGTQVAVFSLGSSLNLLQGFTSDPAALLAAVSRKQAERDSMAQTHSDAADDAEHTANLTAMRSAAPALSGYIASAPQPTTAPGDITGQNPAVKGPLVRYSISFIIRAEDVAFSQAPNGERIAKLLIGVKAYGADGSALNWRANREAAQFTPEEYASVVKNGLPIALAIDLPATTPARLVTAVYDWNTSRTGSLEIPVNP